MQPQRTADEANYSWNKDVQFPPLRSLDEFVLDKARFDLPSFNDLPKWNNRIFANLLFFQSNYFLIVLTFILLTSVLNLHSMVVGVSILGFFAGFAFLMLAKEGRAFELRRQYPYIIIIYAIIIVYLGSANLSHVCVALFSICLPLILVFIHASIRLRGLNNKLHQKFFEGVIRDTVMAKILRTLNVEPKA